MNISSHAFCPTRKLISVSGNKRSYFDYFFVGSGFCKPYPSSGSNYGYFINSSTSTAITGVSQFPILPFSVYDRTNPFVFVLILY